MCGTLAHVITRKDTAARSVCYLRFFLSEGSTTLRNLYVRSDTSHACMWIL